MLKLCYVSSYKRDNWKTKNEITGKQKTKSNPLLPEIKVDKTIIENLEDITKEFNKFNTSVAQNLAKISNTEKNISRFFNVS